MKLQNSTDFPCWFLRRMISWVRRQLELPASILLQADFSNCRSCGRGRAWSGKKILVRTGPDDQHPSRAFTIQGEEGPVHVDRIESLVSITAHELEHLRQFARFDRVGWDKRRFQRLEPDCIAAQKRVLRVFREQREALLAAWQAVPVRSAALSVPKPSLQEQRLQKAEACLARWQRKLKLASTKVKHYRKRVQYYEGRKS